eukprot:g48460.t1
MPVQIDTYSQMAAWRYGSPVHAGPRANLECPSCRQIISHACPAAEHGDLMGAAIGWQKILYQKQPFPDNYVDESFLSELVTNANVHHWSYWTLSLSTLAIVQRISAVTLLLLAFFVIYDGRTSNFTILCCDLITMCFGVAVILNGKRTERHINSRHEWKIMIMRSTRRLGLLAAILLGLSPVLQTLTSTYSSDTIWALSFLLLALHLIAHDYSYINTPHMKLPQGSVSLSAGIFSSVLLASRLENQYSVFLFLLLAFLMFAGFPLAAHHIRSYSLLAAHHIRSYSLLLHSLFTLFLYFFTLVLLVSVSTLLCWIYSCSLVFIVFVCPMWLKGLQRYKNEVQGPWDYQVSDTDKFS